MENETMEMETEFDPGEGGDIPGRMRALEEKVDEIATCLSLMMGGDSEKLREFMDMKNQEEEEALIKSHCEENGLNYDDATDYSKAANSVRGESLYYSPLGFIGANMGPRNASVADTIKEIAMARRDLKRFRDMDREIQKIHAWYLTHRNEHRASAKAAGDLREAILKLSNEAEHPYVRDKIKDSSLLKQLNSPAAVQSLGYEFVKEKYDDFLTSQKLLNWFANVTR